MLQLPPALSAGVTDLVTFVRARFGSRVQRVVLFGSYARGEADPLTSDADLLVVIDGLTWREHYDIADRAARLSCEGDVSISPLVVSADRYAWLRKGEFLLAREIERDGIAL